MLKYNLGQVVILNGSPSEQYLIVGKLKNPLFSSFEDHYVVAKPHTLQWVKMTSEKIINHLDTEKLDSFSLKISQEEVLKIYENLCRQVIAYFTERTTSSGREHQYEIISKQSFMNLFSKPQQTKNNKEFS